GIELIRLLECPAIVLVPTITIREQWVRRIEEAFLCQGITTSDYISQDIKNLKLITVTTYQSIHSAMSHYQGELIEEESEGLIHKEDVDYHDYDFLEAIRDAQIQTICLDECHHLRSEWWKSLELLKKEVKFDYTIALTATPPYDSSVSMWNRYIDMCGEIDEEITVPELVKEGSLCPHQDFVYFNYPTSQEEKEIKEFQKKGENFLEKIMNDSDFQIVIQSHICLHGEINLDTLLEKPEYLSSLLIYLEAKQLSYPFEFQKILGYKKLEKMSIKWLQILLQGLLYDDTDSFQISEDYHKELIKELKSLGFIEKNKVMIVVNQALEKMLVKSVGKCESIKDIVFHEYGCLKNQLRLLILTDYIRSEYEKSIGDESRDVHNLGVLPFFELLRRENQKRHMNIQFGVLCGTMVIIPSDVKEQLLSIIDEPKRVTFTSIGSVNNYVKVNISGDQHFIVGAVSQLFEMGSIQVLIGTKSLLGEGWDSPCVNTLILASFVGSFMLSNQMRGRAIRTFIKEPDKTSHIWHLVCVDPKKAISLEGIEASEDYQTLCRRMEHFLGLHYTQNIIENGTERLTAISLPLNKHHINKTNQQMLKLSSQRDHLKKRWNESLAVYDQIEVIDDVEFKEKMITAVILVDAIRYFLLILVCGVLGGMMAVVLFPVLRESSFIIGSYCFLILLALSLCFKKIVMFKNPLSRLQILGEGVLQAMKATGQLESYHSVVKTELIQVLHCIYLAGGTGHDKTLFAKCMYEFFEPIDNQRYILFKKHRFSRKEEYFVVPEIFAKRKEDAEIFAQYMKPFIGKYQIVYTRNQEGRQILLNGRIYALANQQERCITRKKVKGALE
ncbi:DEAD/DEAH box helicase family protein, partial [Candidatus Stoquefichus massiliensis]|uniref:DEAD/DEAH box helicase family protein n=1 Tax=Candidatus Stoquefichus massiliensis TaxID=1470350 RepID=UPI0005C9E635